MSSSEVNSNDNSRVAAPHGEFSLVEGGPLHELLLKVGLLRPQFQLLRRRMLVIVGLAWLPLLALTLAEGHALRVVSVPFLLDIETYARFLIALPILLWAEVVVHRELNLIIQQFRSRRIIPAASLPRFEQAIANTMKLRNSRVAELTFLALVFVLGPWAWQHGLALETDTWYASVENGRLEMSPAGWWFIWVSAPMFQFLLLRWYFRLALWWRLLWQISRLPLELRATHPDRAGGLGFIGESLSAFTPVLLAQSVLGSGFIASRVLAGMNSAIDFRGEAVLLIVILVAVTLIPLLFFSFRLVDLRRDGLRKYNDLASTYVRDFERKWLEGSVPADEPLLGSADIQSLADLAGSVDIVRDAWPFPFEWRTLFMLVVVTMIPFFPLVLTVIPFAEMVRGVVEIML